MKAWPFIFAIILGIFTLDLPPVSAQEELQPKLGAAIDEFTVRDCYGKPRKLTDFKESKLVVVAFLGTECPLAKLYGPRLESLRNEFEKKGVAFIGMSSNTQDSITELVAYRERHKIGFPLLKDLGNKIADRFGAVRTPEVFVLDADRKIRYYGRIDDQYHIGIQREAPQRRDLAIAIKELLAGKEVSKPMTESIGCHIGRASTTKPQGEITYSKHIAPIFNRRCVECHRDDEIAPFPLTSYDEIEGWGDTIVEVIQDRRMPPWTANPKYGHFSNDARLTDEEKKLVFAWIDDGLPEGDPADLPEPPKFAEGWRIPKPDLVIPMSDKPFEVPAEGVVDYQYFTVDPGFKEDKYVMAAECRPGNRAVVHHIIAYIQPPGAGRNFRRNGSVDGYSPGSPPKIHRPGQATFVPAGSKIVFEMHYTPNGSEQKDISSIGIKFMDKADVKKIVRGELAINPGFAIPPGEDNHEVIARRKIRRDAVLLSMTPHMHLRGKSFRYEAEYPTGEREVLLDVPRYDFNWQLRYELAKPLVLPKGTILYCTAHFDNSEDNLANPDPTKTVRWGNQSWEEMMIGFFNIVPAEPAEVAAFWQDRDKIVADAEFVDPSGVWRWTHKEGIRTVKNVLKVDYEDGKVTGTYRGQDLTHELRNIRITGNALAFDFPVEARGRKINIEFNGKITGDELQGTVSFVTGERSLDFPWKAKRDEKEH